MSGASATLAPEGLLNRELSWLEFNHRVLEEAMDPAVPLLERVKFFRIFSANLDEFFEVRVAGLKQQMESATADRTPDGLTVTENLRAVIRRVRHLVERQYKCWRGDLRPALAGHGLRFLSFAELSGADRAWVEDFYRTQVRPVLTPLGLDPAHPFPQLLNKSLNGIVQLEIAEEGEWRQRLAVVQVPRVLPRLVKLPRPDSAGRDYLFLGALIGHYLADLFPGTTVRGFWRFRVTRNSELYIDEEETANLRQAVEKELLNRRRGDAVRLEVQHGCPLEIRVQLLENLGLTDDDLFLIDGPVNPIHLAALTEGDHSPELRYPPFVAPVAAPLRGQPDLFAAIHERDQLLHHPYENFSSVVDFLRQAAADPQVLAVKQTLCRTGGDPQIVGPLMEAANNGKQVTVVVERDARSDPADNLLWARRLEEAGVQVLFGLAGCKINAKMCLVVRKDRDGIRRYLHLGTGNYNTGTARLYTDLSLLTCKPAFGEDATNLFNLLTGICQFQGTRKLLVAPFELHGRMISLIEREAAHAQKGLPARIIAKMNALTDPLIMAALCRASQAGAQIDLIVRGICCLRPRVKGLSERITVRSIVDRFLEHSRIFYFENACQPEVFAGSADWMPRNFLRRLEVVFPVEDGNLRERIRGELLETMLQDNVKARFLQPGGSYTRPRRRAGAAPHRSQDEFIKLAQSHPPAGAASGTNTAKFARFKLAASPFAANPE